MEDLKQPHPIDVVVGSRIRRARLARGLSQGALADQIGVTFQQVQKYENGSNRISASKLVEVADTLGVPASSFLEGLGQAAGARPEGGTTAPGASQLLNLYAELPPPMREAVLQIVRSLADSLERPRRRKETSGAEPTARQPSQPSSRARRAHA